MGPRSWDGSSAWTERRERAARASFMVLILIVLIIDCVIIVPLFLL